MPGPRFSPRIQQHSPDIWILDPKRAIDVPGENDATWAAARLVPRQTSFELGVIRGLHLPGDDAVFDVDHPGATAGTVDAVRAANDTVVLPAVPIELFPRARVRIDEVPYPAHELAPVRTRVLSSSALRTDRTRCRPATPVIAMRMKKPASEIATDSRSGCCGLLPINAFKKCCQVPPFIQCQRTVTEQRGHRREKERFQR